MKFISLEVKRVTNEILVLKGANTENKQINKLFKFTQKHHIL